MLVCLFAAIAAPPANAAPRPANAPIAGLVMPAGASLATATGVRLFPNHAGSTMPGWLDAYNTPAMRILYRGYCTREALGDGYQLVVLREQGLLGAYLFLADRCVGQVLGEPFALEAPERFKDTLRRSDPRPERRILTTRDRTYGLEALSYERRLGPMVERRLLVDFPDAKDGVARSRLGLGVDAIYPARFAERMEELTQEAGQGLVEFWRGRQGPDHIR